MDEGRSTREAGVAVVGGIIRRPVISEGLVEDIGGQQSRALVSWPMPIKIAMPDLISNSYFLAFAACELGILHAEGLDAELVPICRPTRPIRRPIA